MKGKELKIIFGFISLRLEKINIKGDKDYEKDYRDTYRKDCIRYRFRD